MSSELPPSRPTPADAQSVTLANTSVGGELMRRNLQHRLFGLAVSPTTLGRFQLLDVLGSGGMGVVYRAYDPQLDRRVAVKVVAVDGVDARRRMMREAQALARLSHPHVVTIHEVGEDKGELFVAMEYVDGGTLESWCRDHPERTAERTAAVLRFAAQAIDGLAAAHALGIVHRDVKPANLLIGRDGRLRVGDFGLARPPGETLGASTPAPPCDDATMTASGAAIGTPAYMSPEQFRGHADARSDQFGLCVSIFEALWGTRPFAGSSAWELIANLEAGRVHVVDMLGVPAHVHRALLRGLDRDPERRFGDLHQLAAALRPTSPRRWAGLAFAGVAAVSILGTLAATRAPACTDDRARILELAGPATRDRLAAAIVSSGRPHPDELTARVGAGLDAIVERWSEEQLATCRIASDPDPAIAATAAHRRACLDEAWRAVETTLAPSDVLGVAEANSLPHTLAAALDVIDCREADPQTWGTALGIELVARHREGLLLARAPDLVAARAAFDEVLARTEPHGLPSLRADARLQLALLAHAEGALDEALDHAIATLDDAERSGDPELIALGWVALLQIAPDSVSEPMFDVITDRVHAQLRAGRISAHVHAQLVMGEASMRFERGDHARAASLARDAVAIAEPIDHPYLPEMYATLAGMLQLDGDPTGALVAAERALVVVTAQLGEHHPALAPVLVRLANVQAWSCDDPAAIATADRVIALHDVAPDHLPSNLLVAYSQRAGSLAVLGRLDEATADLRHALSLATADDADTTVRLRFDLAHVLRQREQPADALAEVDAALSHVEGDDWRTHSLAVDLRLLKAALLVDLGQHERGRDELRQIRGALDEVFPAGSMPHMQAVASIARIHLELDELDAAQRELARYLDQDGEYDPPALANLQEVRAHALLAAGRVAEARAWGERAIATVRATPCGDREAARLRAWLDGLASPP